MTATHRKLHPITRKLLSKVHHHKFVCKKLIIVLGLALVVESVHLLWENGFNLTVALHGTMILGHMLDAAIEGIPDYIEADA